MEGEDPKALADGGGTEPPAGSGDGEPGPRVRTIDPLASERPVLEFIEGTFQPAVSRPLLEAGTFLAARLRQPQTLFGVSVAGPFAEHESGLASQSAPDRTGL